MREGGRAFLVAAAFVPLLLTRLGFGLLRTAVRSRRGVRTFRRTLRRTGMGRVEARRLADTYRDQVRIRRLLSLALRAAR